MKLTAKKNLLTAAFGLLFVFNADSQDYFEKIFPKDYGQAAQFIASEKWMNERIESFGLKPKEVLSIVFPELIRFNSIQDKIEIFALQSLYVKYGKDYSNFSVGPFQVKPSFAESLEKDFIKFLSANLKADMGILPGDTLSTENSRAKRLTRLKDVGVMMDYICSFYRLMEKRHATWASLEEKIKFISTAYNCGYQKSETEINSFIRRKFFHTGLVSTNRYSYADISWYYYTH